MRSDQDVLKVREAAEYLRISEGRLREYIYQKRLPAFQLVPGGAIRIHRQVLDDFLRGNGNGLPLE